MEQNTKSDEPEGKEKLTGFANAEAVGDADPNTSHRVQELLPPIHPPRNFQLLHLLQLEQTHTQTKRSPSPRFQNASTKTPPLSFSKERKKKCNLKKSKNRLISQTES